MNEGRTTAIFGVVAAITLGLAWWSRPDAVSNESDFAQVRVNEDVFPSFQDPSKAASMQIVKYQADLDQKDRFEVARDEETQLWSLPSNDGYPADAAEQVRDAITPLIGLRILEIASSERGDHELYGVVNPDDEVATGAEGVGMLVRFKDDADTVLASLIVGKEVEQVDGQRYVRIPTEDVIYKVELKTDAFTTDFRDWIEGELLDVRSFDITKVAVRDYELRQSLQGYGLLRNFDAEASYDPSSSKWSLASYQTYDSGKAQQASLGEDEELNSQFLNDLRNAIQDLEIMDVRRKPKGLAADLKADETLLKDTASIESLANQGFIPSAGAAGTEIYAVGGETIVGTDAGVEYVLRFGNPFATLAGGEAKEGEEGENLRRYLLVTARLDESKFPVPELEPVPETVEEMLAREGNATAVPATIPVAPPVAVPDASENSDEAGSNTEGEGASTEPSGDSTTEDASANTENEEAESEGKESADADSGTSEESSANDGENTAGDNGNEAESGSNETGETGNAGNSDDSEPSADPEPQENSAQENSAQENSDQENGAEQNKPNQEAEGSKEKAEPAQAEDPTAKQEPKAEIDATTPDTAVGESQPNSPTPQDSASPPQETEEELKERLEAVREQITKENQRKIDERNEKIDEARKRVQELNARFSQWYYVVSDSVYKKLKVTKEGLIQAKGADTAAPAPTGLPNFGGGLPPGLVPPQP